METGVAVGKLRVASRCFVEPQGGVRYQTCRVTAGQSARVRGTVFLLHPGNDDRSRGGHVALVYGDLAGGEAHADAETGALGGRAGEDGHIAVIAGGQEATGDAFFLGSDGDPAVQGFVLPGGKTHVDRRPLGVVLCAGGGLVRMAQGYAAFPCRCQ